MKARCQIEVVLDSKERIDMNAKRIVSIHPGTDKKGHWVIEGVDEHGYVRYYDLKNWVSEASP